MSRQQFYAHTDGTGDKSNWQPLREHLLNTANLARQFAQPFDAGDWGYMVGPWFKG